MSQESQATTSIKKAPEKSTSSRASIPYVATLVLFIGLLLGAIHSSIHVIGAVLDKLMDPVQDTAQSGASLFQYVDFSSYFTVAHIATLLICLPGAATVAFALQQQERRESWRLKQTARRAIYTAGILLLLVSLVMTAIGTTYSLLSTGLDLKSSTTGVSVIPYAGMYQQQDPSASANQSDIEFIKIAVRGIYAAVTICLGITALTCAYTKKRFTAIWITLGTIAAATAATVPYMLQNIS